MDRQRSMRQASSQRTLARSGTTRHAGSSMSLAPQESRQRLAAPNEEATQVVHENDNNDGNASSSPSSHNATISNASSSSSAFFDKLELLGPSLLEVLTLVNPPQPRAQQELEQEDNNQQAGEETTQGGDAGGDPSNIGDQGGSNAAGEPFQVDHTAKFDTCLSRSAILGKVADAAVDNSRKTQEYFAKILDKLHIEATGLVLLQDSTIVIFLETTADQFLVLCKQLLLQRIIDAPSMRVLASCDDNAGRILQGLYFKKVAVNRQSGDANNSSSEWNDDSFRQLAIDTFLNLIKFVKKIGPMVPAEIRKTLTNLTNTDQMFLPSNDLVLWLLGRDEFMGLDEFLHIYDSPIEIELESERVWPVHPLIHY